MLSNFLGVKPEQNLRDLSYPISSFRKLRECQISGLSRQTRAHRWYLSFTL